MNNNIYKKYIWDELLSYQIKYLMHLKYEHFATFFGYNEMDKILYNPNNKFFLRIQNLRKLFVFQIEDNKIYEIYDNNNLIEFPKDTISFFEIKTSLNNEGRSAENIIIKNSIILTFIKNSLKFRNSFLKSNIINRKHNINLILLINSQISEIPSCRQILKKKLEYYIKNIELNHPSFKLYILPIDSENLNNGIEENANNKVVKNEINEKFGLLKLSFFILIFSIIITLLFYYLKKI